LTLQTAAAHLNCDETALTDAADDIRSLYPAVFG